MKRLLLLLGYLMFLSFLGSLSTAYADQSGGAAPGSAAPELVLEKILQAPAHARADWQSLQGKVVVLDFWATWCAPCIALQPHLNALAEKFRNHPVYFISITNEPEAIVAPFLRRRPLKGWVGLDPKSVTHKAYGVTGIPRTVVVDQGGRIVTSMTGTQEGQKISEDLLNQLLKTTSVAAGAKPPYEPPAGAEKKVASGTNPPAEAKPGGQPLTVGDPKGIEDEPLLDLSIRRSRAPEGTTSKISSVPLGFSAQHAKIESLLSSLMMTGRESFPRTRMIIPAELQDERFDILCTLPPESQPGKMGFNKPLMIGALEAALGIKISRITREADVYVLTAPEELTGSLQPTKATGGRSSASEGVLAASSVELGRLAAGIEDVLNVPVIDETGLQGKFDWDLVWEAGNPRSIIDAVRTQFGLELTPARRKLEIVIVGKKQDS